MEDNLAWFEFLLKPSLLESHLKDKNSDASSMALIVEFIFSGLKRNDAIAVEGELVDPTTQKVNEKKRHTLAILPLQVAAHLNWNLRLFLHELPLHILDSLLIALLHEIIEEYCIPTSHVNLDTSSLNPHQLFAVGLYHRYALGCLVKSKLPSKPVKMNNIPIPGQQDPMQESREVQEGIMTILERGAETSIHVLELLLTAAEVRAPVLNSFSLSCDPSSDQKHDWTTCKPVPDEQFKYQIHYELGNYHFLHEHYAEAFHHFSQALQLVDEIGDHPLYCEKDEDRLRGFHASCSAICGRNTPVEKRTLFDRFSHSLKNNYEGLIDILRDDNVSGTIPFYLRETLQLDLMSSQEPLAEGLLFQIQMCNTVGNLLAGRIWDNAFIGLLIGAGKQAGKQGMHYLVQMLVSKLAQYSPVQKNRIRTFIFHTASCVGLQELLVPSLISCAPLASLFTHEEIVGILPASEEKLNKAFHKSFDVSFGGDHNDPLDVVWDLIHSHDPRLIDKAYKAYITNGLGGDVYPKDVMELNSKWETYIPIPVHNTLAKVVSEPQRSLTLIYIAKSQELCAAKSFEQSLNLLSEAMQVITSSMKNPDTSINRPSKMVHWMTLSVKIEQQIYQLPCADETSIQDLSLESKQCLASMNSNNSGLVPWTSVVDWCILLLLNVQEWSALVGPYGPPTSHFQKMVIVSPLANTAQALQEKGHSKVWKELFETVVNIMKGAITLANKRSASGQMITGNSSMDRHRDSGLWSRSSFLEFLESVREPTCLSLLISLFGHLYNLLTDDPSNALHVDHAGMWHAQRQSVECLDRRLIEETISWLVDHSTKLYPSGAHTSASLSSSWFLTKADLAYAQEKHHKALKNYLTAILVATDYLRNDTNIPQQNAMEDIVIKRMIRCCMSLNSYTQAAILCQFLSTIDYTTAVRCLQERSSIDAMDAYYTCLYDVTLMEFIINMHQKRGEKDRRDKVLKIIGLLEINSNNNEEIQREAAKVRKHRFIRAMAKQYL